MRFTISPEQIKFFQSNGYLELENLLNEQEASFLLASMSSVKSKAPGYLEENLFRSIPFIASLARKRAWGEIAYMLIQKKPIRIGYDRFFPSKPQLLSPIEESECGLLLDLKGYTGLFFKNHLPTTLSFPSHSYLLLVLTPHHLPEQIHPVILR